MTGAMGGPASASSMAGARTSARVSFPDPKRATTSSQAAGAPGTTSAQLVGGRRDLQPRVAARAHEVQGQSRGAPAPTADGADFLGGGVEIQAEGVPADARAGRLAHVQARRDGDRRVRGGTALPQDLQPSGGRQRLRTRHHAFGPQRTRASALEVHRRRGGAPRLGGGGASEPPIAADRTPRAAGCDTTVDVSELPGTVSKRPRDFQVARAWSVDNARIKMLCEITLRLARPPADMAAPPIEISAGMKRSIAATGAPTEGDDMLEIMPLGAGSEVGRSCVLAKYKGKSVMFDCGVHPGYAGIASLPYFDEVDLSTVDCMLVTHFHLDHCAAVPFVVGHTNSGGAS